MRIRRYQQGEEEMLRSLLYDTVHRVNNRDYSQAHLNAWAPQQYNLVEWVTRLAVTKPFVAEINGVLVGFAELEGDGHINCFYSAYNYQSQGIGTALLEAVERDALALNITRLFAEVSITAKGFFLSKGFILDEEQTVLLGSERLTNYVMSKKLAR